MLIVCRRSAALPPGAIFLERRTKALCCLDGDLRLLEPGPARCARTGRHRLRQGNYPGGDRDTPREGVPAPRLLGGCGDHRRRLRSHIMLTDPMRPSVSRPEVACLHAAAVPAGPAFQTPASSTPAISEGCVLVGGVFRDSSSAFAPSSASARPSRVRSCSGADFYETDDDAVGLGQDASSGHRHRCRHRPGDRQQERADRRRRPPGQRSGVQEADGDGWHMRSSIIVVPKGATIKPGTVV